MSKSCCPHRGEWFQTALLYGSAFPTRQSAGFLMKCPCSVSAEMVARSHFFWKKWSGRMALEHFFQKNNYRHQFHLQYSFLLISKLNNLTVSHFAYHLVPEGVTRVCVITALIECNDVTRSIDIMIRKTLSCFSEFCLNYSTRYRPNRMKKFSDQHSLSIL